MSLLYTLIIGLPLWLLSSLISYFLLFLLIIIIWRAYKTYLVRRVKFLNNLYMRPIEAGQTILITGATSGIGLAVAKYLYGRGYSIIGTYFKSEEPGYEQLKQLSESSPARAVNNRMQKLLLIELDVRQSKDIEKAYCLIDTWLAENNLELYGLINNAGLGSLQPFAWLQRTNIFRLIDTNILGYLLMTREFLPLLAKCQNGSRILFVSSGLGFVPGATYAAYGLAKCAQIYFAKCLNLELKQRYRIQSVAVIPHNFIKNTNICAANVQINQLAWDELKPIERQLYKLEFEEHLARVKLLEEATRELQTKIVSKLDRNVGDKIATPTPTPTKRQTPLMEGANNQFLVNLWSLETWRQFGLQLVKFASNIVSSLNGENTSLTLEESGALECFEDALRLRDPPEQIFAGDSIFQLLIGSLLLALPHSCTGLLSGSIAPSLYK